MKRQLRQMYEYIPNGELFELRGLSDGIMAFSRRFGIKYLKPKDILLFKAVGNI